MEKPELDGMNGHKWLISSLVWFRKSQRHLAFSQINIQRITCNCSVQASMVLLSLVVDSSINIKHLHLGTDWLLKFNFHKAVL